MVSINKVDGAPLPQEITAQTPAAATREPSQAGQVAQDSAVRVTAAAQTSLAELGPVPLPKVQMASMAFTHAESFTAQLREMGGPALSTEELLSKFLKLQMLGGSWDLINQFLTSEAYSSLRQNAYEMTKSSRINQVDSLRAQAESLEQQADGLVDQATQNSSPEGLAAAAEAQGLYDLAKAKREAAANAQDPAQAETLKQEAANLEQQAKAKLDAAGQNGDAESIQRLQQAESLYEQAGAAHDKAGSIMAGYTDGLAVTATVRPGSDYLMTQVRSQDYLKELTNKLRALLDSERADKRALTEALRQMEESRIEVAALLLNFIDRHSQMTASASRART